MFYIKICYKYTRFIAIYLW